MRPTGYSGSALGSHPVRDSAARRPGALDRHRARAVGTLKAPARASPDMDAKRSFRWAGTYFLLTGAATLVGGGIAALGLELGAGAAYYDWQGGQAATGVLLEYPLGFVLLVVGLAIWWFGKTWALYATLTGAVREDLAEQYDTEKVKSEVLTVLDDRLSDLQQDLNSMNRSVRDLKQEREEAGEFDFGD
jgi:hypothetical protein